eukprot:s4765_g1.t1
MAMGQRRSLLGKMFGEAKQRKDGQMGMGRNYSTKHGQNWSFCEAAINIRLSQARYWRLSDAVVGLRLEVYLQAIGLEETFGRWKMAKAAGHEAKMPTCVLS